MMHTRIAGTYRLLLGRAAALCLMMALCLLPTPAAALFHIAVIDEVMSGLSGTDDVQFVEIRMLAGSQNIVTGSKLSAFDANGNFLRVVLTVGANVAGGMNRAWIMGSTDFAAASGITPDFTFTSSGGLGLEPNDGMVCWGKPSNEMNAGQYVDCVAYGNYVGPTNVHIGTPNPLSPNGRSLVRISNTNNSAADFACNDPAEPENNAMQVGSIAATTPCPVCGNNTQETPEQCDGTDDLACPGLCAGDCTCITVCGDNVKDLTEQCDGTDDAACPGNCQFDCTCAVTGPIGSSDQKCITSTAKAAKKTVSAVGKEVNGCVKSIAGGAAGPLDVCVLADAKQKISKSETKLADTVGKVCPTSAFAYAADCPAPCDGADVGGTSEAIDTRDELVACLLCLDRAVSYNAAGDGGTHGEILTGVTLATTSGDAALASCQAALVKATEKLFATQLKAALSCVQTDLKLNGLVPPSETCIGSDPKDKILKATEKLIAAAADCTPPAAYDAGECATLTGAPLSDCLARRAACESCIWSKALFGATTTDCDVFDNGLADASCP